MLVCLKMYVYVCVYVVYTYRVCCEPGYVFKLDLHICCHLSVLTETRLD